MGLLTLQEVSQSYEDRKLLDRISLVIGESDRVGLIGPNGSGKSTLLRILAGLEPPDDGQRTTRRGLRIGFLEQDPTFTPGWTIREAIRAGFEGRAETLAALDRIHERLAVAEHDSLATLLDTQARLETELETRGGHDVEHRIESTARALGLADLEAVCDRLSGGERRRVALARLLLVPHDLLVLDEPTNHLDAEVTSWLEDRLMTLGTALVLVTHDRYFLD
ncbi:MAG: ABC-F family ATP-binding cassette domain-containing protein, partial [Planctomycetes bacterium]|nr:ABC-F family ATP-binding cassette domain-containing protein [Planctomycetota bacterium]